MKLVVLSDNETIELRGPNKSLVLYVTLQDDADDRFRYGFKILSARSFITKPQADNSIVLIPEPHSTDLPKGYAPR